MSVAYSTSYRIINDLDKITKTGIYTVSGGEDNLPEKTDIIKEPIRFNTYKISNSIFFFDELYITYINNDTLRVNRYPTQDIKSINLITVNEDKLAVEMYFKGYNNPQILIANKNSKTLTMYNELNNTFSNINSKKDSDSNKLKHLDYMPKVIRLNAVNEITQPGFYKVIGENEIICINDLDEIVNK